MPLINCKVRLKLKWTNHCVLSAFGAGNNDANPNNIIFAVKFTISTSFMLYGSKTNTS